MMNVASSQNAPRQAVLRRLLGGALPVAALLVTGKLVAADAINTASLSLPSGTVDTNPANNTVTESDTIAANLLATNDLAGDVNGLVGATNVVNVFTGDTVNGNPATVDNTILSVAAGSTVPDELVFIPPPAMSVLRRAPRPLQLRLHDL